MLTDSRSPFVLLALFCQAGIVGCDAMISTPQAQTPQVKTRQLNSPALAPRTTIAAEGSDAEKPTGSPRVVIEQTHFHFGQMDPLTMGEHMFVVQNAGTAPLVFGANRSTCKCTISQTSEEPVLPGASTSIRVRWQTRPNQAHFQESATIATNDPVLPELKLSIEGHVLVHVTASPPELELPDIKPDETPVASTTIASQVWDHFAVDEFSSSLEGIRWQLLPADPADLARLQCRAGYRLQLTLPNSLPQGDFTHWIRFRVDPQQPEREPKQYELALRGRVLRRLAVYGPDIDQTGTVHMGLIDSGQTHRHRLLLKVRDPQPNLMLRQVSTEPAFLAVSLTPLPGEAGQKGLYHLDIEIPADASPGRTRARKPARSGCNSTIHESPISCCKQILSSPTASPRVRTRFHPKQTRTDECDIGTRNAGKSPVRLPQLPAREPGPLPVLRKVWRAIVGALSAVR